MRSIRTSEVPAPPRSLDRRPPAIAIVVAAVPIVIALALLAPALSGGFQLDDHFQRDHLLDPERPNHRLFEFYAGDPDENRQRIREGTLPWWTASDFRHSSLRTLSALTASLDFRLWPDSPRAMHLHSLLWFAGLLLVVGLLYRRVLVDPWLVLLATTLYAVDEIHVMPVAYLANRNATISAVFGVLCLLHLDRATREGRRASAVLSPVLLAAALAAGETALAVVGYLLAHAVFVAPGPLRSRLARMIPHGLVLLAWAALYRFGGYGARGSGWYVDPAEDPLWFLSSVLRRAVFLLVGQWTPLPADAAVVISPGTPGWGFVLALFVATLVTVATIARPLFHDPWARCLLAGSLLALIPLAGTVPQNRLLQLVALGAFGLLGKAVAHALDELRRRRSLHPAKLVRWAAITALLLVHLVGAPLLGRAELERHAGVAQRMVDAALSLPVDPARAGQTLVLINPPDPIYTAIGATAVRTPRGLSVPARVLVLANGQSAMEIHRVDDHTLRLRLEHGLFPDPISRYYRSPDRRFTRGDSIRAAGASVLVEETDADGTPVEIVARFDLPLDAPALLFAVWRDDRYRPWSPPPVGALRRLPRQAGLFAEDGR